MRGYRHPWRRVGLALLLVVATLSGLGGWPDGPAVAGPGGQAAGCGPESTTFFALLNGAQEVPATPSSAVGGAYMQIENTPGGQLLRVRILAANLNPANVTLSHIHSPAPPGQNAPVTVNFFLGPVGTFTLPFSTTVPITDTNVLSAMRSGLAYVNVHTSQFPGGEIRGQINCVPQGIACAPTSTSFATVLTGSQEVPPVTSSGVAFGSVRISGTNQLSVTLVTTGLDLSQVTLSHIHSPAPPGQNAPVSVNLFLGPTGTFTSPFSTVVTATSAVIDAIRTGNAYLNIHTVQNPNGELRGQLGCFPSGALTNFTGLANVSTGAFALRASTTTGPATINLQFGPVGPGAVALLGDWDGDGVATPGLYDPATGQFFLRNSNTSGVADVTFTFGPTFPVTGTAQAWIPIVGDWTGAGASRVGLYDPVGSVFHLRNSLTSGVEDITFVFGPGGAGWLPIAGNWQGSTTPGDKVGLYNPQTSQFFLRNSNTTGIADTLVTLGVPNGGYRPIAGDWTGTGKSSVGLYLPSNNTFYLRNTLTSGQADTTYSITGVSGTNLQPLSGKIVSAARSAQRTLEVAPSTESSGVPAQPAHQH